MLDYIGPDNTRIRATFASPALLLCTCGHSLALALWAVVLSCVCTCSCGALCCAYHAFSM
jgi:hypothetical protein